ncbi:hypothetical protein M438DRAFT_352828 [Aureobasidium pullulans EXF-150]|uniref:MAGE domain-containing protein n=1 Tax=Aureobasidium pullulans EXF-150 TaxID=1043002 RepID=A0A074XRN3_AURPU|nr:uncharacterized protein M438DRAFT_352828 [Aureobasidium pullulans EXF-150]KEQ88110.1 hypothetical protein M438DRAFT_352828 [Aureobasidium pullulans EXF-150]
MSLVALQPANEDPEDSDAEVRQPQRRRVSDPEEDDFAGGEASIIQGDGNFDAMVKNMVRLALACEYSRTPIRRADITAKILGTLPSTKSPILCHCRNITNMTTDATLRIRGCQSLLLLRRSTWRGSRRSWLCVHTTILENAADDAYKASTSPAAQHGGDQEGLAPRPRDSPYLPPFSPI